MAAFDPDELSIGPIIGIQVSADIAHFLHVLVQLLYLQMPILPDNPCPIPSKNVTLF